MFDLIGERTNVKLGDNRSGYSFVYAFDVDLGEEIKLEHGFMQINAIDEHDETIDCYLALFTASSSTGYGLVKMDMRDGNEPSWMGQLPICFCFKGDGSFISDKALKFNRLLSPWFHRRQSLWQGAGRTAKHWWRLPRQHHAATLAGRQIARHGKGEQQHRTPRRL